MQEHITEISSDMYFNTIEINLQPYLNDVEAKPYVEKLKSFVNDICPMPITLDLSNYKEKSNMLKA